MLNALQMESVTAQRNKELTKKKMVVEPNVGLEITKGVGRVVIQELHGILELVCW